MLNCSNVYNRDQDQSRGSGQKEMVNAQKVKVVVLTTVAIKGQGAMVDQKGQA